jgi:hypothetical protein
MAYFSSLDFDLFWKNYVLNSSSPASRLLFWFFGKTGINALLPAFSAFFCYSLIFYTIRKTKQLFNISNQTVAIVLFHIMTTSIFISVVGGIRMMLALSMITFSYFRATVEKKITVIEILFFIVSTFIHTTSFVAIGIVALTLLFDSNKSALKKIGSAVAIGVIAAVFVVKFSGTAQGLYNKFLDYILGDKHSDMWEYLMGAFITVVLLLVFGEFRHLRKDFDCSNVNKCNLAAVFCVILAICFCFEFSIFYRFGGHLAVMFSIPSMMIALEKTKGKSSVFIRGVDLKTLVILLSCIIAAISCARGSLCSLKFFEL